MAYKIEILEGDDRITKNSYIRPMTDYNGMFDRPLNYYAWRPVLEELGDCWLGKKVKDLKAGEVKLHYELMRHL